MKPIRVMCVDDEPSSLQTLHMMLIERPDVSIIAESSNPLEAIQLVKKHKPDLLFLDIQMPAMSGFEVLQHIQTAEMPFVVFVTAYERYAIKAFETHALDYVLKPYDHDRIGKAIDRAKERLTTLGQDDQYKRMVQLLDHIQQEADNLQRFFVRKKDKMIPIKPEDIDWIEAAGDYVHLHVKGETFTLHEKIGVLETTLRPKKFIRVHRSMIVNVNRIKELVPVFQRDFTLVLHDGTRIKLGRSYAQEFFKVLKMP